MPATIETRESYEKSGTTEEEIKAKIELLLLDGAIRSKYHTEGDSWIIVTEWNIFGQQDEDT